MKARPNREKSEMMSQVLSNPRSLWQEHTNSLLREYEINKTHLNGTKYQTKRAIKESVNKRFKNKIPQSAHGKSKMDYFFEGKTEWQPGKRAKYMNSLTRKQASLIFKARTRMLKVKGNYKNGFPNLQCRLCKITEESQTHILEECPDIHSNNSTKIPKHQLFMSDADTLKKLADKIYEIIKKITEAVH